MLIQLKQIIIIKLTSGYMQSCLLPWTLTEETYMCRISEAKASAGDLFERNHNMKEQIYFYEIAANHKAKEQMFKSFKWGNFPAIPPDTGVD